MVISPLNYNKVSITSVCCKVLERVIVEQVVEYLKLNSMVFVNQFSFSRGRNVEDKLLVTYAEVVGVMDRGFAMDMIFLNISKASDVVNHPIILEK